MRIAAKKRPMQTRGSCSGRRERRGWPSIGRRRGAATGSREEGQRRQLTGSLLLLRPGMSPSLRV